MLSDPLIVTIEQRALTAFRYYLDAVPGEVGGIGLVAERPEGPHIFEVFILLQTSAPGATELDAERLAAFVDRFERHGGDPVQLRCWWHSHGDLDVGWSETDEATIAAFPGEGLVSLVGNRRGDLLARLDRWGPACETRRAVRVVPTGDPPAAAEALRARVQAEVAALVRPEASVVPGSESAPDGRRTAQGG